MINLLPTDVRENFVYSRRNTKLLNWSLVFLAGIAGVALITAFGMFFMNQSIKDYSVKNVKAQQVLKDQKLNETEKQIEDISNNLKLVVKVLSKEVLFSKLINQIATAIPSNASLSNLKISNTQGAVDLTFLTKDYGTGAQIQFNLQDPSNKIFNKADIVSISCSAKNNSSYPCTVSIRALFASSNSFQFISPSGGSK